MKKLSKVLAPVLGLALLGGVGATAVLAKENVQKVRADDLPTEIAIDSDFFTNWDTSAGTFGDANSAFWGEGYSFNAMGSFFRGESNEGWNGTLISKSWKQQTQYIYFTWSAQDNSEYDHLVFYYGSYNSGAFKNNAFVENTMMLWYFKIPDEQYATFNGEQFDMHVELVDQNPDQIGAYRFNNFGFLHANQTRAQVGDAMRLYLNKLNIHQSDNEGQRNWSRNKRAEIYGHYYTNGYLSDVFLDSNGDNVDEDFESNSLFLNHWSYDWSYDNNDLTAKHFDKVISTFNYRPDDNTNMPFNKSGNGYFKGWYAGNTGDSGFTETDGAIYRFVSRPFVLSGTGLISVKMAGRSASIHILSANSSRSELAYCDVKSYCGDGDTNNITSGINTVTMVNHVINLEEFVGQKIQIAIADVYNSGWAASYFDNLVTKYATAPNYKIEFVTQTSGTGTYYATYFDRYICSTPKEVDGNGVDYVGDIAASRVDSSASYQAHQFISEYLSSARNESSLATNACNATKEVMTGLISAFNGKSDAVKNIIIGSDDFQRVGATTSNWATVEPTRLSLGYSLNYFAGYYNVSVSNPSGLVFGAFGSQTNIGLVIGLIVVLSALCTAGFFFYRRKRLVK